MKHLLTNGRIVDVAENCLREATLAIENGRFVEPPNRSELGAEWQIVNCDGRILLPSLVDLYSALPDSERDIRAALAGGFTTVCTGAHAHSADSVAKFKALQSSLSDTRCEVLVPGALTQGLEGQELTEMGLMARAGAAFVSQGLGAIESPLVLQRTLEYAERLDLTVFIRGGCGEMEHGGVARSGPWATQHGLPAIYPEAEEIGIHRVAALARATGARVHLTHIWSARGVEALQRIAHVTPGLTASTTVHHLFLSQQELSPYAGTSRFHPPIGNDEDRTALVNAVKSGLIQAVSTDHSPRARYLKDCEFENAAPGAVGFEYALPMVLECLGGDLITTAKAMSLGPNRVLHRTPQGFTVGGEANFIVDPDIEWSHASRGYLASQQNTPLHEHRWRGRVEKTWRRGEIVFDACELLST